MTDFKQPEWSQKKTATAKHRKDTLPFILYSKDKRMQDAQWKRARLLIIHNRGGNTSHCFIFCLAMVSLQSAKFMAYCHSNKPIEGIIMKKSIIALIMFTTAMGISNASFAVDAKTLPGATCQPDRDEFDIHRNYTGSARNQSSSGQYWTCPIVRDSMAPRINSANMKIVNATGTMSCTLYSRSSSGGYITGPNRATGLSGGAVQTLSWGAVNDANNGYYYFRCYVPSGSKVISYYWNENT